MLGKSAYIKLVDASTVQEVTLEDVKQKFQRYVEMTTKTGQQLGWDYAEAAFPYTIVDHPDADGNWFYLKGKDPKLYKYIIVGVGTETIPVEDSEEGENREQVENTQEQHYIQVILPDGATHGDVTKANEYCKFLAKQFQAQLKLFNGRLMYYYPRKLIQS